MFAAISGLQHGRDSFERLMCVSRGPLETASPFLKFMQIISKRFITITAEIEGKYYLVIRWFFTPIYLFIN